MVSRENDLFYLRYIFIHVFFFSQSFVMNFCFFSLPWKPGPTLKKFIWGLGVAIVIVVRPSNRIRNRKLCVTDVGLLWVKQQVGHQGSCRKRCCGTKSKLKHLKRCVNKCISQRWKQNGLSKQMLENMVYPKQMIHLVVESLSQQTVCEATECIRFWRN